MHIKSHISFCILLSFAYPISAQSWTNFGSSCSSWQGFFGSTNGVSSTASLTATCSTVSGQQTFSTLDLNTCYGYPGPGEVTIPGSGLMQSCVVSNVPNSVTRDAGQGSGTVINMACPGTVEGTAFLFTLDLNENVGNNNGVLACGFM
ncbi:hypothetical protein CPB84DRAFT_826603 [Gymnopilus junonius]|uniref:Cyanovirin-N domain-containing protein n=1 Tax=Gymnopilus junonius TaxID=109634 RepID=A0A9P5N9V8_GYMJU|nr:hypothetical protein CPB84DRAFT_826603 [Gymnopilus junonius]